MLRSENLSFKFRRFVEYLKYCVKKKKSVLFYCGLYKCDSFRKICGNYRVSYGFEADPEYANRAKRLFRDKSNVQIIHGALVNGDQKTVQFNISSNEGASSSIGDFNPKFHDGKIKMVKRISVPAINLKTFCEENKVDSITDYISDLQGLDFVVLETLRNLIDNKRIESIQCEVEKDGSEQIYPGLPSNNESNFNLLLKENYDKVAEGWGFLKDGSFSKVPEDWWEKDCKWRVKENSFRLTFIRIFKQKIAIILSAMKSR